MIISVCPHTRAPRTTRHAAQGREKAALLLLLLNWVGEELDPEGTQAAGAGDEQSDN